MRRLLLNLFSLVALALAGPALATDFVPGTVIAGTPSATFLVSGNPFAGPVSAQYGRAGLAAGSATDRYIFTLGQTGVGTGDVTTTFTSSLFISDLLNPTNLDLLSVRFFNGTTLFNIPITTSGNQETAGAGIGIPITLGAQNILSIEYLSRGFGAYSGTLNFLPTQAAIPEPGTWAMMLAGFGLLGAAMRRKRRDVTTRLSYSAA